MRRQRTCSPSWSGSGRKCLNSTGCVWNRRSRSSGKTDTERVKGQGPRTSRSGTILCGGRGVMALVTKKKIGVLMGGLSSEREVSLASGKAVLKALTGKGYHAVAVDVGRDAAEQVRKADIGLAFNALHGKFGEDGAIQGLLEVMGIPYTGSGILASAMGMNKIVSKTIFRAYGLAVGPFTVVSRSDREALKAAQAEIGFPLVVKPSSEGSSVGV